MKQLRLPFFAAAALVVMSTGALAQDYPTKLVKIVTPFSAGSITDALARTLSEKLAEMWKQQVIVENRPGLAGTTSVAKSAPDGYTLMLTSNGHTIAAAISKGVQFDPVNDFAGISMVASVPLVVIAPPDLPANTLTEFIALAKQKPGQLNFASAGLASMSYLAAEILRQNAKISMQHVPFRGAPEGRTAVLRGDVQMYFASVPTSLELIGAGKLKVLAINGSKRIPQLPEVPTITEAGVPDYNYDPWFAVMAPAGTPPAILAKVSQDIAKVVQMPDVGERLRSQGAVAVTSTPEQLDTIVKADTERFARVLKDAGIEPQ
jgi:tripartite-type tricarboxylate transporter receptor subunit TctC